MEGRLTWEDADRASFEQKRVHLRQEHGRSHTLDAFSTRRCKDGCRATGRMQREIMSGAERKR
eukprot:140096-Rhodomonas_salina.1